MVLFMQCSAVLVEWLKTYWMLTRHGGNKSHVTIGGT